MNEPGVVEYSRQIHDREPAAAERMLNLPNGVVCVAAVDASGLPRRLAAVRLSDEDTLLDIEVEAGSYEAALRELKRVLLDAQVMWSKRHKAVSAEGIDVIEWNRESGQKAVCRLLNPDGSRLSNAQAKRYPWLHLAWRSAGGVYSRWYAEPVPQHQLDQNREREARGEGRVSRWLGRRLDVVLKERTAYFPERYEPKSQGLPDATGEPVADARLVIAMLRQVAGRTAAVSPDAPFL
jgi:hypothetical protein